MRSQVRLLVLTLVVGPAVLYGVRVPGAVARMESFRIQSVEVRGVRVLAEDSVVAWMQLGPYASVWGDRAAWEERLAAHPMIRSAAVRRRLPHGLRVSVEEREAVALAATPTLEAVDAEGHRLPIDPTRYRLDLPVISTARIPAQGAMLFPEEVRLLAAEVDHLTEVNGEFMQRVSTVTWLSDRALVAHLISPDVDFILPVHIPGDRLREGEAALSHALASDPGDVPQVVDLRFAEQVVVRRRRRRVGATASFTAGGR
jgi:hypothetical protein